VPAPSGTTVVLACSVLSPDAVRRHDAQHKRTRLRRHIGKDGRIAGRAHVVGHVRPGQRERGGERGRGLADGGANIKGQFRSYLGRSRDERNRDEHGRLVAESGHLAQPLDDAFALGNLLRAEYNHPGRVEVEITPCVELERTVARRRAACNSRERPPVNCPFRFARAENDFNHLESSCRRRSDIVSGDEKVAGRRHDGAGPTMGEYRVSRAYRSVVENVNDKEDVRRVPGGNRLTEYAGIRAKCPGLAVLDEFHDAIETQRAAGAGGRICPRPVREDRNCIVVGAIDLVGVEKE